MLRYATIASALLSLAGCGLGESAAVGASKAEEVKEAQKTQERYEERLEDAQAAAAAQRAAAEAMGE